MTKYPLLKPHKTPFDLRYTDKLVKLLVRIAETKPCLEEYLGQPLELQLLRQAKIRAITFSNQIEGNRLEERGVTQIVEAKDLTDLRVRYKLRDLCDLQKLVTRNVLGDKKQSGALRTIQVNIADARLCPANYPALVGSGFEFGQGATPSELKSAPTRRARLHFTSSFVVRRRVKLC